MSIHRRRSSSPPPAVPPLEVEDLLSEILLRLPPDPSSLPRASAVCKRWRSLVSDPRFTRSFRLHHRRNPPLLGFFNARDGISFQPTLEAPNRVPPERFSLQLDDGDGLRILNSRHGLVLFLHLRRRRVLVWDPLAGEQHSFAIPTAAGFGMGKSRIQGAVFRAAGEVHHFRVVLVVADENDKQHTLRVLACVYSSEIGEWGNPISTPLSSQAYKYIYITDVFMPAVLVGGYIYWPLYGNFTSSSYFVEFDLERQSLATIELPVDMSEDDNDITPMRADDGGLGFLVVSKSELTAQLWKRKIDRDGVASWLLGKTIELDKLLSMNPEEEMKFLLIFDFAECSNVVGLWTHIGQFMVELESLQFKKLSETEGFFHPFESVYAVPGKF